VRGVRGASDDASGVAGAAAATSSDDAGASGAGDYGDVQLPKRRAYDNVSGKVSGRPWKATFGRASSLAGRPPSDWEAKMAEKAKKKAIQARPPLRLCGARSTAGARRALRRLATAPDAAAADAASGAQEHVAGIKKEARDKAVAEKKRREEVKTRREANRKASQVVQKARAH
jgi:hypothetical protein